ncbi:hypothetical protein HDE_03940 [Halotydeus destructor]|nr:hypothetical protein HDE_03940 [Halotydeus destructor]
MALAALVLIAPARSSGRVKVKVYDHRAQHDPAEQYGSGPWHYLGYGYGIQYEYDPNFAYQRQKGYGFLQAYGRDHCADGKPCRPSDPDFFRKLFKFNGGEPFYGAPPAHYEKSPESAHEPSPYPEWMV